MIDISSKEIIKREASASGRIRLKSETLNAIIENNVKKGDVIETARIAGTMAVKNTAGVVPYCHNVPLSSIDFDFKVLNDCIESICTVKAIYRTGVEMEAIHGVMVSLLTIWDMVKYMEKDDNGQYPETLISDVKVLYKVKS
ncbi:cyclic pyranopterin monophosphate synthase MoaC [Picrophilus oshimae]|uniref:Cyclic pyranopterin monophosphate synthase subunit MoaC n=1 Tax=Picrophilus torridus (strain ATCC 700027 / DSM 9790 / JCM 10055 / NBRC 100828 / KAW 2/3) TaxID=1122961 RepID=Q6L056_PICTO|nr:cyclic pyranopterin monophosphate synthase MoaC [Picrophilus oshimae]AAT43646.1 molybdenum cofactor biosynthesis protein C [Picrophilus oshimae DSM 9789]SMD31272.1 cyclic pyranopterin monophosphate synthase subunit MoaC [Picrophilus oshimae DSM 9789]